MERERSRDAIVTAIAKLFAIAATDVLVVDNMTEAVVSTRIKVLCERTPVKGDFARKLSIYIRDLALEQGESKAVIGYFSAMLHCKCLIPDQSPNP